MRFAIVGAGKVGATLAGAFATIGHEIVLAARDPQSASVQNALAALGGVARALPLAEGSAEAEIVVLATPWAGTESAVRGLGPLGERILIDCTNPLTPDLSLVVGHSVSGGELVAGWADGGRVVKAFNTTGFANMADPRYPDGAATMFLCGDHPDARRVVADLAAEIGFDPADCGPLRQARLLEPMAVLWISLAVGGLGTGIAFRLMRR